MLFMYAEISFAFYRELFDSASGLWCETMYQCFVTMHHVGLIVGLLEVCVAIPLIQILILNQ